MDASAAFDVADHVVGGTSEFGHSSGFLDNNFEMDLSLWVKFKESNHLICLYKLYDVSVCPIWIFLIKKYVIFLDS